MIDAVCKEHYRILEQIRLSLFVQKYLINFLIFNL